MPPLHSDLPIIQPPRKSGAEKYGLLLYLGISGLVALVLLIGWFLYGVWSLRGVLGDVYTLTMPNQPLEESLNAAVSLRDDPNVMQRQLYDWVLSRQPPPLGRYILGEALTSEVVESDPRGFALMVARSEGWPDWLRLILMRPLAYAAGEGTRLPAEALEEIRRREDPVLRLWATYALAFQEGQADAMKAELDRVARSDAPEHELAALLRRAIEAKQPERNALLDEATPLLRRLHPDAARLWEDWEERDGRLVRRPAPELRDGDERGGGPDRADDRGAPPVAEEPPR